MISCATPAASVPTDTMRSATAMRAYSSRRSVMSTQNTTIAGCSSNTGAEADRLDNHQRAIAVDEAHLDRVATGAILRERDPFGHLLAVVGVHPLKHALPTSSLASASPSRSTSAQLA